MRYFVVGGKIKKEILSERFFYFFSFGCLLIKENCMRANVQKEYVSIAKTPFGMPLLNKTLDALSLLIIKRKPHIRP